MIRVLHLRSSPGLYGADRALLELCEALVGRFDPVVGSIVPEGEEDLLGAEARRRKLAHLGIPNRGRIDPGAVFALSNRLSTQGISLVHAHDYKSLSLGLLAARRTKIPVVATYHGDTAATAALRAYEALARVLGNATQGVAAVSAPLARKLRGWIRKAPVLHIPNGIRVPPKLADEERVRERAALGISPRAQVLAIVGRLSTEKGHRSLIAAVRRMSIRPVVLVAGGGPLEAELRDLCRGLDFRWLGFLHDTRPVYAAADAVVIPSVTEGLPLVALETMALGRPLIAHAVGELPTLLSEGAGFLVQPGNEAALAHGIEGVLLDTRQQRRIVLRARARVEGAYTLEKMAERYARELYELALRKSRIPGASAHGREWSSARAG
jgi:glycosyltransferase involved in cell wall biosynthesis